MPYDFEYKVKDDTYGTDYSRNEVSNYVLPGVLKWVPGSKLYYHKLLLLLITTAIDCSNYDP